MQKMPENTGKTLSPSRQKSADKRTLAIRYYYQGYSLSEIVTKIKAEFAGSLVVTTVKAWVDEHLEVLKESRPEVVAQFKHVELERITQLEIAYWEAWEKSQTVQITTKEVFKAPAKVPGKRVRASKLKPLGELESTIRETKTLTGEARYLQGIQWCIEQRMKMLGVEAPKKNEFGNDETSEEIVAGAEERNSQPAEGGRRIVFKVVGG